MKSAHYEIISQILISLVKSHGLLEKAAENYDALKIETQSVEQSLEKLRDYKNGQIVDEAVMRYLESNLAQVTRKIVKPSDAEIAMTASINDDFFAPQYRQESTSSGFFGIFRPAPDDLATKINALAMRK